MKRNRLKQLLAQGKPAVGTWLTLGSIPAARHLARSGFDWLCVDCEHSSVTVETATVMLGAIADAGCVPLARVPSNRHDHIKRMLDGGAFGVVVPMVNHAEESKHAIDACFYPPRGNRSVGGGMHALNFQTTPASYFANADEEIAVILQCEHIDAVRNFDAVYGAAPGVDVVFVGPNDLAASLRNPQGIPPSSTAFDEALAEVRAGCTRLGIAPGIHTFSAEEAKRRLAEGWRFVAVGSDAQLLTDGAADLIFGLAPGR